MTIRTDADIRRLREQGALTTAEETLIEDCRAGQPTVLGDGKVPDGTSDACTIRADALSYLSAPSSPTGFPPSGEHSRITTWSVKGALSPPLIVCGGS